MQGSFGHPEPEGKQERVVVGVDEDGRVEHALLFRRLNADSKDHVVAGRNGHLSGHVGKVGALQNLRLVALLDAHQLDQGSGQVGAPSIEVDGDRVLVEDGEVVVTLLAHAQSAVVDNILAR